MPFDFLYNAERHFVMVALRNRADHYIFALWFFLLSFFFYSPNLSSRRLDVCHTSTHGVALVRILDAGLKRAACGSLEMQDTKKSQLRHVSTIGKKLVKQQYLTHMSLKYSEL